MSAEEEPIFGDGTEGPGSLRWGELSEAADDTYIHMLGRSSLSSND